MMRRIAVLAACLLLGAVVSMLVAWACAAWSKAGPSSVWLPGESRGSARRFAEALGVIEKPGDEPWPEESAAGFGAQWTRISTSSVSWPATPAERFTHVRAGWPAPALEGAAVWPNSPVRAVTVNSGLMNANPSPVPAPTNEARVHGAIILPAGTGPVPPLALGPTGTVVIVIGTPNDRILPLRPAWRGFVIDLLFYAVIVWCLLPVPLALRRLARRVRGLCTACAYPMGSSPVCTECGRSVFAIGGLVLLHRLVSAAVATPARRSASAWALAGLAALSVGAIVNVAVAWGCAVRSGATPSQSPIVRVEPDLGWWRRHAPSGIPEAAPVSASCARLGPGKSWTSMWQPPRWYVIRIRAGWPMLAMERDWWEAEKARDDPGFAFGAAGQPQRSYTTWRGALPVPGFLPGRKDSLLPARPVWPGFLLNTLLYATPLLLLRWGVVSLRARHRRRGMIETGIAAPCGGSACAG